MRLRARRTSRRIVRRKSLRIIRVHTEGRVTEREYLRHIRDESVKLKFGDFGKSPMALVEQAKCELRMERRKRAVNRRFDEVWCVFDHDGREATDRVIREAVRVGVKTAVSNPCFELWIILHMQDQTGYTLTRTAQKLAQKLGLMKGKNLVHTAADQLRTMYGDAKRRARALDTMHQRNGSSAGSNPSSSVWRIADRMRVDWHD